MFHEVVGIQLVLSVIKSTTWKAFIPQITVDVNWGVPIVGLAHIATSSRETDYCAEYQFPEVTSSYLWSQFGENCSSAEPLALAEAHDILPDRWLATHSSTGAGPIEHESFSSSASCASDSILLLAKTPRVEQVSRPTEMARSPSTQELSCPDSRSTAFLTGDLPRCSRVRGQTAHTTTRRSAWNADLCSAMRQISDEFQLATPSPRGEGE
jgi:hypothetical protein